MALSRTLLLALAGSPALSERARRAAFVRRSLVRFMPGEHLDDALRAAADLRRLGMPTMLTRLGENLTRAEEAEAVAAHYLDALDRIDALGLDAQLSVKPTQLGLDLDPALCARHLERLVDRAGRSGRFVWIDMESYAYVDRTLALFRQTRERFSNAGVALQAYLYRTASDVESLLPLSPAIRLVKGAYLEPSTLAFPKKADVDRNYHALSARLLAEAGRRPGVRLQIATHDRHLIDRLRALIVERQAPDDAYEHAMLYGIQRGLQERLTRSGHPVRVLISYGENWFPWFMRRLAERPANVWFVLRNLR